MSEQEKLQAPAKLRRNRRTQKQNGAQPSSLPLPAKDDKEGWKVYWKAQGQPWRTEPEIDTERQKYLAERRSITPDGFAEGIYPFKDIKLNRADIEWLLATHENGLGPVDWSDESQRTRDGLDLRGCDLRDADLRELPLTNMIGALASQERSVAIDVRLEVPEIHLGGADLTGAHLEGANLSYAHLEGIFTIDNLESEHDSVHVESRKVVPIPLPASLTKSYLSSCEHTQAVAKLPVKMEALIDSLAKLAEPPAHPLTLPS